MHRPSSNRLNAPTAGGQRNEIIAPRKVWDVPGLGRDMRPATYTCPGCSNRSLISGTCSQCGGTLVKR